MEHEPTAVRDLWALKTILSTPAVSLGVQRDDSSFPILQEPSCDEEAKDL